MFGFKLIKDADLANLREEMSLAARTLEDIGWINLSMDQFQSNELIAGGFRQMLKRSKIYYVNNPLAKHWIHLTTAFVFGEGLPNPKAKDKQIQTEVVDRFWADPDNKKTMTNVMAQHAISNKIQYEGNIFFMLFDDEIGDVRVRIVNTLEVMDIVYDDEDRNRPLFYKIALNESKYNFGSDSYDNTTVRHVYVPDMDNENPRDYKVPINKLMDNARMFHFKINCDINDKFGVPDLYAALDWIKAHKDMAGDVATLIKALSKFAWKKKIKGTTAQVNTIQAAMTSKTNLRNISTMAGQTQIENDAVDMQSIDIKSGGVDIGEKGLKQMQMMVCAGSGIPYHYWGDPSTSNLATAKSMELPVLKKFTNYQELWRSVYLTILNYTIRRKVDVGILPGTLEYNPKTRRSTLVTKLDTTIDLDFAPILEADLKSTAEALAIANDNGFVSDELGARLFMTAANVDNLDDEVGKALADEKANRERNTLSAGGDLPADDPEDDDKPKDKKEVKEAIVVPAKPNTRLMRKNNYLIQKMNGYRKALASHFRTMHKDIKDAMQVSGADGKFVGNVKGLDKIVYKFAENMKASAKTYFPMAVSIGEKYVQAHLRESNVKVEETLYEKQGRADKVLRNRLAWNAKYVDESLMPDIVAGVAAMVKNVYESDEKFREAINDKVLAFESRVDQYVGALWTVEEDAVKEAGKGTGLQVNFVGEEDEENCEGCAAALAGNPWPIDEAPIPGEQNCHGNCRHALQIID